jgi:hypothetical protein
LLRWYPNVSELLKDARNSRFVCSANTIAAFLNQPPVRSFTPFLASKRLATHGEVEFVLADAPVGPLLAEPNLPLESNLSSASRISAQRYHASAGNVLILQKAT